MSSIQAGSERRAETRRSVRGSGAVAIAALFGLAGATVVAGAGAASLHARLTSGGVADVHTTSNSGGAGANGTAASPADSGSGSPASQSQLLGNPYVSPARIFSPPVVLPGSTHAVEPSMARDHLGNIFITAPTGWHGKINDTEKGNVQSSRDSSPVWKSSDNGATWTYLSAAANVGPVDAGIGGGDSDIVVDNQNNIYVTSLWLGNTSTAVSTDDGKTWTGIPWGHVSGGDDRPWFAYGAADDSLYMGWDDIQGITTVPQFVDPRLYLPPGTYDPPGALHVGKASLRGIAAGQTPAQASILMSQDVNAVVEDPNGAAPSASPVRDCVCPPGGLTVGPDGTVYLAFSAQDGMRIAESHDGGKTWDQKTVPNTSFPALNAVQTIGFIGSIKADSQGTVYLAWAQVNRQRTTFQIYLSWLPKGASSWHSPVLASVTKTATYPTLAVVSPGVVDVAYYGDDLHSGDPASLDGDTWDVYATQITVSGSRPVYSTVDVVPGFHVGAVNHGMGDFFTLLTDPTGMAEITYNASDSTGAPTGVFFTGQRQAFPPPAPLQLATQKPATRGPLPGSGSFPYPVPGLTQPQQPHPAQGVPPSGSTANAPASNNNGSTTTPSQPIVDDRGPLAPIITLAKPHTLVAGARGVPANEGSGSSGRIALLVTLLLFAALSVAALAARGLRGGS